MLMTEGAKRGKSENLSRNDSTIPVGKPPFLWDSVSSLMTQRG